MKKVKQYFQRHVNSQKDLVSFSYAFHVHTKAPWCDKIESCSFSFCNCSFIIEKFPGGTSAKPLKNLNELLTIHNGTNALNSKVNLLNDGTRSCVCFYIQKYQFKKTHMKKLKKKTVGKALS